MAEKRNEIMEEQRKAREEFLRLKKMQQGEIEPERKPSEVAIVPKTFGEKFKNFWYHYKVHTIIAAFLVVFIAVATVQCATRKKYDYEVMYFAYAVAVDVQMEKIEEYLQNYAEDVNGDGEVNVRVINCGVADSNKDVSRMTMYSKVQSIIAAEKSVTVYIVDEKAMDYFENAFDFSIFAEQPHPLSKDFYEATKVVIGEEITLPKGLAVGVRIIEDTAFEGDEEAEAAFSAGKKLIENIKKQNS